MSGLSANKLGAFLERAIPRFHVTMRTNAMSLSLADGNKSAAWVTKYDAASEGDQL